MSSRKELAGVRIDICSLREALHKIEHYIQEDGLHAVEAVSMKTVVTRRKIPKDPPKNGDGGNTSTVHQGAGGRTFGGGGRGF